MLARIDHRVAAGDLPDRRVQPLIVGEVLIESPPEGRWHQRGSGQQGNEPGAVDAALQLLEAADIHLVPAAEACLADLLPEGAAGEQLTAAAVLVREDTAAPHVDHFTGGAGARQFAKQAFGQRAPTPAHSAQVNDRWHEHGGAG